MHIFANLINMLSMYVCSMYVCMYVCVCCVMCVCMHATVLVHKMLILTFEGLSTTFKASTNVYFTYFCHMLNATFGC